MAEHVGTTWTPTHRTPQGGAQAWMDADPGAPAAPALDALLEVMVIEQLAHGWTLVRCENGWETWIDGGALEPLTASAAKAASSVAIDPAAWEFLQIIAPQLRGPLPASGVVEVETKAPAVAPIDLATIAPVPAPMPAPAPHAGSAQPGYAQPGFGPPHGGPPGGSPGGGSGGAKWMILLTLIAAAALAGIPVLRANTNPFSATAELLSVAMVGLLVLVVLLGLLGLRKPARVRIVADLARGLLSGGAAIAMGTLSGAPAKPAVLIGAGALGLIGGVVEGALSKVAVGRDQRKYARRPVLPVLVSSGGLLLGTSAAVGNQPTAVGVGQAIGLAGAGLLIGVAIGRLLAKPAVAHAAFAAVALVVAGGAVMAPIMAVALATGAAAQSPLEGTYKGSMNIPPAALTPPPREDGGPADPYVVEFNETVFEFRGDKLTGTQGIGITAEFTLDGTRERWCFFNAITLTGSELTYKLHDDGTVHFDGEVSYDSTFDESGGPCTGLTGERNQFETATLSIVIDDKGLTGTFSNVQSVANGGQPLAGSNSFHLDRVTDGGSSGGGGGGGSTGGGETGGGSGTGGSSTGSTSTGSSIDPDGPKLSSPDGVQPKDAAAVGIATVAALAGAGIINAAEAAAATAAIKNGAVPDEVIATLTKGKDLSPLFPGVTEMITMPPTPEQNLAKARDKLAASGSGTHPTFTAEEYVEWVKDLERRFPGSSRGTIIAAIHAGRYLDVGDVNGFVPKTQVRLFEQGPESDGWEAINRTFVSANPDYIDGQKIPPYVSKTPWYITDHSRRLIDINHAMAGLRNDVNRPPGWTQKQWFGPPPETVNAPGHPGVAIAVTFDRDTLRWINTDGGDSYQVATNNMTGKIGYYPEWAPADQRLGNAAGMWMGNYLRDPAHANASVSQALEAYLKTTWPAPR